MRRLALIATALAAAVTMTGCGYVWDDMVWYAYDLEVTGTAATSISIARPDTENPKPVANEVPDPSLPFKHEAGTHVKQSGDLTLRVIPKDGEATCRIVIDGKEVVKKTGPAGIELVCATTLKGVH
jgi:hypothetical protein